MFWTHAQLTLRYQYVSDDGDDDVADADACSDVEAHAMELMSWLDSPTWHRTISYWLLALALVQVMPYVLQAVAVVNSTAMTCGYDFERCLHFGRSAYYKCFDVAGIVQSCP